MKIIIKDNKLLWIFGSQKHLSSWSENKFKRSLGCHRSVFCFITLNILDLTTSWFIFVLHFMMIVQIIPPAPPSSQSKW